MPRTTITPITAPGQYPTTGTDALFIAADVGNGNQALLNGKTLLIAYNSDMQSPAVSHSVTVTSYLDAQNRLGDITDSIPEGHMRIYGPFPNLGWKQPDGNLYFSADNATVKFLVIALP
jgi:hypothetical protein